MSDVFTPEQRSEVMSRIRSTGTKPEERMAVILREILGHRWRIDRYRSDLPGRPDFVVPTLSLAVFVDGCFFHMCPRHGRIPDTNVEYWRPKLNNNVRRDRSHRRQLRSLGYSVVRFWEHDLSTKAAVDRSVLRVARIVDSRRSLRGM